jgi:hypothetical protein
MTLNVMEYQGYQYNNLCNLQIVPDFGYRIYTSYYINKVEIIKSSED